MTDQAFKDLASLPPTLVNSAMQMRARNGATARLEVVSLSAGGGDHSQPASEESARAGATTRDWSSAIGLVQEASEAIRISVERADQLEEQLDRIVAEARDEIARLTQQIAAGDQKLVETEQRVTAAEARATEAEGWLARFHDAVISAFTPVLRNADGAPHADGMSLK